MCVLPHRGVHEMCVLPHRGVHEMCVLPYGEVSRSKGGLALPLVPYGAEAALRGHSSNLRFISHLNYEIRGFTKKEEIV